MENLNIRPFRQSDLSSLIKLAKVAFADEFGALGISQDQLIRQVRSVTWGRMIPFWLLSKISGITWGMLVAEVNGRIVGFGSYQGQENIELSNLMVDPAYRRRGIGQALLIARLEAIANRGYQYAITRVREDNEASLRNLRKQGFEVFDRYDVFEAPLPVGISALHTVKARLIRDSDKPHFQQIERELYGPAWQKIEHSKWSTYAPQLRERIQFRFSGAQLWSRTFEADGKVVGFIAASSARNQDNGGIFRPVVAEENLDYLSTMVEKAGIWLQQQGKGTVRMAVFVEYKSKMDWLAAEQWKEKEAWLRLVKWF